MAFQDGKGGGHRLRKEPSEPHHNHVLYRSYA